MEFLESLKIALITIFILVPSSFLSFLSLLLSMIWVGDEFSSASALIFFYVIAFCTGTAGLWFCTYMNKSEWHNYPRLILLFTISGIISIYILAPLCLRHFLEGSPLSILFSAPCVLGLLYLYDLFKVRKSFYKNKENSN